MDIDGIKSPRQRPTQRSVTNKTTLLAPRKRAPVVVQRARAKEAPQAGSNLRFPLPRYYAPERPVAIVRKRLNKKVLALRVAGAVTLLVLSTSGVLGWKAYTKFHKVFHGT